MAVRTSSSGNRGVIFEVLAHGGLEGIKLEQAVSLDIEEYYNQEENIFMEIIYFNCDVPACFLCTKTIHSGE